MRHGEDCLRKGGWYANPECRAFSTDGTALGADVAHLYGTDNEEEIRAIQLNENLRSLSGELTGMTAGQADWEEDDPEIYSHDDAWGKEF